MHRPGPRTVPTRPHRAPTRAHAVLALAVAAASLVAGCTGEGGLFQRPGDAALDGGGGVRAIVTDEELQPLAEAAIHVAGRLAGVTDEAGAFLVRGVSPGVHAIEAHAPGHRSQSRDVVVAEGRVVDARFILERLPSQEPYVEVLIHTGFAICDVAYVYGSDFAPRDNCPLGERTPAFQADVAESWRYIVAEMEWRSGESMIFVVTHEEGVCNVSDPCWGMQIGASPLRVEGAPGDQDLAAAYANDGQKAMPEGAFDIVLGAAYAGQYRETVNATFNPQCQAVNAVLGVPSWMGCPFGVGYNFGVRYEYYLSVFHYAPPEAPHAYTGLHDA